MHTKSIYIPTYHNGMTFVALVCSHCGGTIQLDEKMQSGFCIHCGTKVLNDKYVTGSVTIDKSSEVVNHLKMAKEAATIHDWTTLVGLVDKILLMDPDCADAWYMKGLLSMTGAPYFLSNLNKVPNTGSVESHVSKGDNAANKYGVFSQESIIECWGSHTITVKATGSGPTPASNIPINLNGRETLYINGQIKFGLEPGSHTLSIEGTGVSKSFTVEDDMDVYIESIYARPYFMIQIPPPPSDDAVQEKPKKRWFGLR